ncbi:uncharacterized protein LOC132296597 [Cornus florida]|uniref:uncharacterized protein LOC132296597 n=1 Tax=Cornus florida TaxID=4283 RepID=UPI0028A016A7|nr:uncharacterized protein LOC132296597 [Cornus florida]
MASSSRRRNPSRGKTRITQSHDSIPNEKTPPPSPIQISATKLYRTPTHKRLYEKEFLHRKVAKGKVLSHTICDDLNLNTYNLFNAIGLGSFVGMKNKYYPRLVQLFYTHLEKVPGVEKLQCYVAGVEFDLDVRSISKIFHFMDDGIQFYSPQKWFTGKDFDKLAAIRQMSYDSRTTNIKEVKSKQLTMEARLIHKIIAYSILPKTGSRSKVSRMEIFLIWCVLNGKDFDLAYIIFHHMLACKKKKNTPLHYAMVLTHIFMANNIPLDKSESAKLGPRDILDAFNLDTMGLKRDPDGMWFYPRQRRFEEARARGEEIEDVDDGDEEEHESHDSAEDEDVPVAHRSNHDLLLELLTVSRQNQATLQEQQTTLEHQQQQLDEVLMTVTHISEDFEAFRKGLEPPPPST